MFSGCVEVARVDGMLLQRVCFDVLIFVYNRTTQLQHPNMVPNDVYKEGVYRFRDVKGETDVCRPETQRGAQIDPSSAVNLTRIQGLE